MTTEQMNKILKADSSEFATPLERDAAKLAGLNIADFRKLHGNTRNMWKRQAFAAYKAAKLNS